MRQIPDFSEYYINEFGQIFSFHTNKFLKGSNHTDGYIQVCLFKNKQRYWRKVHRLVLETFIGSCPFGMEACHNDGNPKNNTLENLRWDSHKNNFHDSRLHGTVGLKHCSLS